MNQNINVDLIPKFAVYGNLYFSQYDVGREAIINLVNGSTEYEIPSGATVTLVATKPSGLGFTQNCTFEGNQITVVCTAEMTDEAGHFPCEIRIANGSLLLGTANFTFNVERSPHPEGTTDGTADSVINQITVAFESAMTQIENSGGLTNDIKEALLNCFQKVAWIDGNGQDYYDALEEALYNVEVTGITLNSSSLLFNELNQTSQLTATLIPSTATNPVVWTSSDTSVCTVVDGLVTSVGYGSATITASAGSVSATCSVSIVELTVVSLNAVLNGGTFYVGDPVDNIKPYLTVTATWSDSTSSTVPSGSYTLSGSLSEEGTNVITVSYGGQSTTVNVTAITAELVSISAVYTQSGTVYATDSLDSLKSDLVVTATYSDSSTATVPSADYTLSGTLAVGTSVITVTYEGKTATFNVTVSEKGFDYSPSDGILSQQSYITVSGPTLFTASHSETDGTYFTMPIGATGNASALFFDKFTTTAHLTAEFKIENLGFYQTSNTNSPGMLCFYISNGATGSLAGFARDASATGTLYLRVAQGSSITKPVSLTTDTWHTIEMAFANNKQTISLDGNAIITDATPTSGKDTYFGTDYSSIRFNQNNNATTGFYIRNISYSYE